MNITKQLGERIELHIFETKDGAEGQLVLMDAHAGDIILQVFSGNTIEAIERAAGRYLRELGRKADEVPTVTGVFVRNDAMVTHDEAVRELGGLTDRPPFMSGGVGWDVLKVMVEFEHETDPRRMRIVHSTNLLHDQLGQNIDSGHYGHDGWLEDPVSRRWRDERARAASTDAEVLEEHRAALAARKSNETPATRARLGVARHERRSRSRAKRTR